MKLMERFNLKTKAAVFVAVILVLVFGISTAVVTTQMSRRLEEALLASATLVGGNLINEVKKTVDMGIYLEELEGLSGQLTQTVDRYPDLGYILVADRDGKLLYGSEDTPEELAGAVRVDPEAFADGGAGRTVDRVRAGGAGYYHITQGIVSGGRLQGVLSVGLREEVVRSQLARTNLTMLVIGLISFFAASGLIIVFVNRIISIPLAKLAAVAQRISDGHLVEPETMGTGDEIGSLAGAFGVMVRELRGMITRLSDTSLGLQSSSEELAAAARSLTTSFEQQMNTLDSMVSTIKEMDGLSQELSSQAESLSDSANESTSSIMESTTAISEINQNMSEINESIEGITTSILQMSATFGELAEGADETARLAQESMEAIGRIKDGVVNMEKMADQSSVLAENLKVNARDIGAHAVEATLQGILSIREDVRSTEKAMQELNARVDNIGEIVTVIEGIADQTNLLALNAAIISAQAGEEGKSFAVIASEIRELSASTTESTKKISALIQSVQQETRNYSTYVKRVGQSVEEGHELGKQAADALEKIVESADESAAMSGEMVKVTREQAAASEVLAGSVEHFTQRAEQIRRATSEEVQTAQFIRESIENAKKMVEKVYRSTEEQSKTSQMINETVLKAEETAGSLYKAMERERALSGQITRAVEDIRTMGHGSLDMARSVDSSAELLTGMSTALASELSRYRGSE